MRLENAFEVPATPDQAWELFEDVPRVVPCLPGAELTEVVDENHWKATMKVKLGPVLLTFAADVERERLDVGERTLRLNAKAREVRGRGGATATIESSLTPGDGGTRVEVVTDLVLSGMVAQYGRSIVQDVSAQLLDRFAGCLQEQLVESAGACAPVNAEPEQARAPSAPAAVKPVSGFALLLAALRGTLRRVFGRARR